MDETQVTDTQVQILKLANHKRTATRITSAVLAHHPIERGQEQMWIDMCLVQEQGTVAAQEMDTDQATVRHHREASGNDTTTDIGRVQELLRALAEVATAGTGVRVHGAM